ncbi:hypothetical protein [Streptomyces sp. NPDC051642]|uniref:hypothetical protein n=1 Tax=unclassified Streptomyces TaxID=2593676 RepID=UPI003439E0D7
MPSSGNSSNTPRSTRIAQAQAEFRPIPADGFPSVGAAPSVLGYYEAVSHSGITLGPVIGRLLAAAILGGERDELLADFRPERFPQRRSGQAPAVGARPARR